MKAIATVDWSAPIPEGTKYYIWDGQTMWGPDDDDTGDNQELTNG